MPQAVLVTGAAGFLGAHIVAAAQARGWPVTAAVRDNARLGRLAALAPSVGRVALDVTEDPGRLGDVLRSIAPRAIVHCAAYGVDARQSDLQRALAINVVGTINLLQAASDAGVERFVHVGTGYEYGAAADPVAETAPLQPRGVYAVSKAAATLAVVSEATTVDTLVAIARPFGIYGPLEGAHKLVPLIMAAGRERRRLQLSPGEQQRDYAYVGDVADGCLRIVARDRFPAGEIFNLCSGRAVTLRSFGEPAMRAIGGDVADLDWGARPYRRNETMALVGDPARAQRELGWRAETSLDDGMRLTAESERQRPTLDLD